MDPYKESIDTHLTKFSKFANIFTKVFIPIVDTAIKMSTQEQPSAYGVFKAAKDLADNKKKSKKRESGSPKGKNHKNNDTEVKKTKADLNVPEKAVATKNKASSSKAKASKKDAGKKLNTNRFEALHPVNLMKELYADDSKKLSKSERKKKQEMERYLMEQMEKEDSEFETEDYESYDSEFSRDTFYDSKSCAEEIINKSSSFDDEEENFSSKSEDDNQAVAITKTHNKRKSHDQKSNGNATNSVIKSKKSKKTDECESASRKTLPPAVNNSIAPKKLPEKSTSINIITATNAKLKPLSTPPNIVKLNSIEEGKRTFKWLLNPLSVDDFFNQYWEQKSCWIKRDQSNYFSHLISFEAIDQMLLKNHVEFTKNIDITSYEDDVRKTLNPEGRALPGNVWHHYGEGCSIRLINPQTFISPLYSVCATMQEYFQSLVGVNAYLTPPGSQGFAPHYDDIEAFVLQIEGRKRWKLYKPRNTSEVLPRYSSGNFSQKDIGNPVSEVVLRPGDVLYFPRGTIHQACTEPGHHSLHITLSVYQKQSYADLFEKMLPIMLQKAISSEVRMRKGLPLHAMQHAGLAFSNNSTKERDDLTKKVTQLMHDCIRDMPLQKIMDAGMDQLAKKFQHEALPPEILPYEKKLTIFGSRSYTDENGQCVCDYDVDERTNVRLLRANILRLVKEDGKFRIYYYLDNSKEYCQYEPNFIEIPPSEAACIEVLIKSYPQYVGVSQLPLESITKKIYLATALWERGLLMMEKPFDSESKD